MQSSRTTLYVEAGSRQKPKLTTAATRQGPPRSPASSLPRLRHALLDPHMHEEVGFVKTRVELGRVEVRQGLLFQKRACLLAGLFALMRVIVKLVQRAQVRDVGGGKTLAVQPLLLLLLLLLPAARRRPRRRLRRARGTLSARPAASAWDVSCLCPCAPPPLTLPLRLPPCPCRGEPGHPKWSSESLKILIW